MRRWEIFLHLKNICKSISVLDLHISLTNQGWFLRPNMLVMRDPKLGKWDSSGMKWPTTYFICSNFVFWLILFIRNGWVSLHRCHELQAFERAFIILLVFVISCTKASRLCMWLLDCSSKDSSDLYTIIMSTTLVEPLSRMLMIIKVLYRYI